MATRSTIAMLNPDGTVTSQYCHWDGYISHNGRILKDHYTDPQKIHQLLSLGSLSSLGSEIGEHHNFDKPQNKDWCVAYGRDRGEPTLGPTTHATVEHWLKQGGQEYNYLWMGDEWLVTSYVTNHQLRSLVQVILEHDTGQY